MNGRSVIFVRAQRFKEQEISAGEMGTIVGPARRSWRVFLPQRNLSLSVGDSEIVILSRQVQKMLEEIIKFCGKASRTLSNEELVIIVQLLEAAYNSPKEDGIVFTEGIPPELIGLLLKVRLRSGKMLCRPVRSRRKRPVDSLIFPIFIEGKNFLFDPSILEQDEIDGEY
ncbi:hypothetical protein KJ840_00105 [Patescibacteria group bacterium]|nr:hypothetical protein [Patescibacteria group bacterium]